MVKKVMKNYIIRFIVYLKAKMHAWSITVNQQNNFLFIYKFKKKKEKKKTNNIVL